MRLGKVAATGGWNTGRGCEGLIREGDEGWMGVGPDSSFEIGTIRSFFPDV